MLLDCLKERLDGSLLISGDLKTGFSFSVEGLPGSLRVGVRVCMFCLVGGAGRIACVCVSRESRYLDVGAAVRLRRSGAA